MELGSEWERCIGGKSDREGGAYGYSACYCWCGEGGG
jgi:hypothetical protein